MKKDLVSSFQKTDETILIGVQSLRSPWLTPAMLLLTHSGTGRSWFIFALVLNAFNFARFHFVVEQALFLRALFCPLLAWIISSGIKRIFSRRRPSSDFIVGHQPMVSMPTCGSFPSSHAAASMAFFTGLVVLGHPLAAVVGIWAVAVSFSRLYLGVHYLSDILMGTFVGVLAAVALTNLPFQ